MLFLLLDGCLRLLGVGTCIGVAVVSRRMLRAMMSSCDSACALARLPPDAYKGKVVWVTGATSGIGKELAVQLAKQGARLILSARRPNVLEEVANALQFDLEAGGGEVRLLAVDLADLASLPGKAEEALKLYGGAIDVLVNNAGFSSRALARDTKGIQLEKDMIDVNFLSWVALTKAVLPTMLERKGGLIINISSLAGKFGIPLRTMYCGAKHAVLGWFDALRAEESAFRSHIHITNVCPGSVKTDVSVNAVTADGSKFGVSDPNIEAGLDPCFVCERILAAAHSNLDEVWIAKWNPELRAVYFSQYAPTLLKSVLRQTSRAMIVRTMGESFLNSRL